MGSCLGSEQWELILDIYRSKGRPHYYARKREEYAQIKFDLDAGEYFTTRSHARTLREVN